MRPCPRLIVFLLVEVTFGSSFVLAFRRRLLPLDGHRRAAERALVEQLGVCREAAPRADRLNRPDHARWPTRGAGVLPSVVPLDPVQRLPHHALSSLVMTLNRGRSYKGSLCQKAQTVNPLSDGQTMLACIAVTSL